MSTVSLSASREKHEVRLTPATEQPETTVNPSETASSARTASETKSPNSTQVEDTLSTTEAEASGFGVLTTIAGFGAAWYLSRTQSEE